MNRVRLVAQGLLVVWCLGLPAAAGDPGKIVAWGDNYSGQCDVPSPNSGFTAIAAGVWYSLGLKSNGSIVAWGASYASTPSPNSGFTAIAAGVFHSLGLKSNASSARSSRRG